MQKHLYNLSLNKLSPKVIPPDAIFEWQNRVNRPVNTLLKSKLYSGATRLDSCLMHVLTDAEAISIVEDHQL